MGSDKADFRVVQLRPADVARGSRELRDFRGLVGRSSDKYPGIRRWIHDKVLPELGLSRRRAFVAYEGSRPVVSAVVKRGRSAKFCHLRVSEGLRRSHVGELFFALMALEVRHVAREIHFTLAESVWEEHRRFFESFGFQRGERARVQYRPRERELRCSASCDAVWSSVLDKLPKLVSQFSAGGYAMDPALLVAIRPGFARRILEGTKTVEVRRRFSRKWIGHRVSLYASRPVGGLVGEATVGDVTADTPDQIWRRFAGEIGCARDEFDRYAQNVDRLYAVALEDVKPYVCEVPRAQVARLVGAELAAPQSHQRLHGSEPWGRAVSVAALLHGPMRYALAAPRSAAAER